MVVWKAVDHRNLFRRALLVSSRCVCLIDQIGRSLIKGQHWVLYSLPTNRSLVQVIGNTRLIIPVDGFLCSFFQFFPFRPSLLFPASVWHGVQNASSLFKVVCYLKRNKPYNLQTFTLMLAQTCYCMVTWCCSLRPNHIHPGSHCGLMMPNDKVRPR
jgi:hypothetical protein